MHAYCNMALVLNSEVASSTKKTLLPATGMESGIRPGRKVRKI